MRRVSAAARMLVLVAWMLLCGTATAEPMQIGEEELARLHTGEIMHETVHADQSGGAARITALFRAGVDEIWDVLGYCKYEFIYLRGLQVCEVLKPGLTLTQVRHRLRAHWYTPTLDYSFEASRTPCCRGEFRVLDGDLDVMEGYWLLERLAGTDYVIVQHEIRVKPALPSPRWLVRRTLHKDLPDMVACMRGLAHASLEGQNIGDDLARCNGDTSSLGR